MNLRTLVSFTFVLAMIGPRAASADEVDDYIRNEMDRQHIPGLSLAVVKSGALERTAGYGLANVETGLPVKQETVFQIQSVTKTFTATAVMLLVEEGRIGLEDKLTKHLDNLPESWSAVTLRHLLSHTSGIKDFINEPTVDLRKDVAPQDVIESLRDRPLNFSPGDRYASSNTGYHLLGMVIQKVTGKSWSEFLQERILGPLQMHDTQVISWADIITNRAAGYLWADGGLQNGRYVAPTILGYAGGGLRSTVVDLAKWDAALYSEKILKQATLEQMWTPARLNNGSESNYGFGWAIGKSRGHRLISHTGSHMTGFKTALARFVDDQLTVIVLTNQREANQMAIATGVATFFLPGLSGGPPPR